MLAKGMPTILQLYCNVQMYPRHGEISADCERLLVGAVAQQDLSARALDRILKVGCTVADLEDAPDLEPKRIAEAIPYRGLAAPIGPEAPFLWEGSTSKTPSIVYFNRM